MFKANPQSRTANTPDALGHAVMAALSTKSTRGKLLTKKKTSQGRAGLPRTPKCNPENCPCRTETPNKAPRFEVCETESDYKQEHAP